MGKRFFLKPIACSPDCPEAVAHAGRARCDSGDFGMFEIPSCHSWIG